MTSPPVFVVADGMGGHAGGDIASALVVESFRELSDRSTTIDGVRHAIDRSFEVVDELGRGAAGAPGSTMVLIAYVIEDGVGQWLLANVGDSRAYGLADGRLRLLSHDHSVVQELVDAGEISEQDARSHPERHVITRAIGAMDDSAPDYTLFDVVAGSRLLLCSDGVSGEIDDDRIAAILRESPTAVLAVDALITAALEAGGHDNITAVVIDVRDDDEPLDEDTLGSRLADTEVPLYDASESAEPPNA